MAFEYLLNGLDSFLKVSEARHLQKQAKSEVISKIREALRNTYKHIADNRSIDSGSDNYSDIESEELSKVWSEAAKAIRPFDTRVAATFEEKSDYWKDPNGFRMEIQSQERRFDFKFRLNEVEKSLMEFESRF